MRRYADRFDGPQRSQLRICPVGAAPGGECYLVFLEQAVFLFDTGFHFCGPKLVENIRTALQGRRLDYIFLSHSHYDHVLGCPYVKAAYPQAQITADAYAAKIFRKPGARARMRELDAFQAAQCGYSAYPDCIDALTVDLPVADGTRLSLGGDTVQILSLPGHTRDCIGFYLEEKQILFAPETLGVPGDADTVIPSYLVSYRQTMDSIRRASALPLRELFTPHAGMLYDQNIRRYFQQAEAACLLGRELILQANAAGADIDTTVERFRRAFYPTASPGLYPEKAFQTNVRIQIPLILQECGGAL